MASPVACALPDQFSFISSGSEVNQSVARDAGSGCSGDLPEGSSFRDSRSCGTVETIRLKTIYVLFFIELSTRRVHVAGVTANPDSAWVTQQARNLAMEERLSRVRFLVHDRDAKYSGSFDAVLRAEGVRVIRTPQVRATTHAPVERRDVLGGLIHEYRRAP